MRKMMTMMLLAATAMPAMASAQSNRELRHDRQDIREQQQQLRDARARGDRGDIREQRLDGLVVASCSPKLHTTTFRGVSRRADLNPYAYTQVNIREQDSWAHSDDRQGATQKAIALVTAGIAKTRLSTPLEPLRVETVPATMVVGGGVTGLRAAIGLADIGIAVILVEREAQLGGWLGRLGPTFPHDVPGRDQVARLLAEIAERPTITVLTNAELVGKTGSFGNYTANVHVRSEAADELRQFQVGTFVIATGADVYQPEVGELGYGIELTKCAQGGDPATLEWVSPRSGCAVGAAAGKPYRDRLLRLPGFLRPQRGPA